MDKEDKLMEMVKFQVESGTLLRLKRPVKVVEEYYAPAAHIGKGDLVYRDGDTYHVIETKWMDYCGSGLDMPTRRSVIRNNRRKRSKVKEQAKRYASFWGRMHPAKKVFCYAIINGENGEPKVISKKLLVIKRIGNPAPVSDKAKATIQLGPRPI